MTTTRALLSKPKKNKKKNAQIQQISSIHCFASNKVDWLGLCDMRKLLKTSFLRGHKKGQIKLKSTFFPVSNFWGLG
jgi:hypothetical protein